MLIQCSYTKSTIIEIILAFLSGPMLMRRNVHRFLTLPQSLNILRYPSLKFWESGVILGTVKSGLEKLQIRSKTCKCVRNLVNTRLMFANTLEKLKMVDMEDDLIHLMVLRRKTPGKYHSTAY